MRQPDTESASDAMIRRGQAISRRGNRVALSEPHRGADDITAAFDTFAERPRRFEIFFVRELNNGVAREVYLAQRGADGAKIGDAFTDGFDPAPIGTLV